VCRSRAGAVAKLKRGNFYQGGGQWMLHFAGKSGKSREIRSGTTCRLSSTNTSRPRAWARHPRIRCSFRAPTGNAEVHRQGHSRERHLPHDEASPQGYRPALLYSPHSLRVTTITDLLTQGVALEDVQFLAGHADPRTTRLYDRRDRRIKRNIVERISV
jgi:integrase/recombinase XerD